ncbi:MAG: trans-sulfuration enzyme family protein [Planctomycetota bacterium]|jgi:cystathionine beta-lyase/cystathionine gamma-synthase
MRPETLAIHFAQEADPATGALVPPIAQTSTFVQQAPGVNKGFDYTRTSNPTRRTLERVLAALEGAEHAAVFSSGIAAENAILQSLLKPGDEILVPDDLYGGTYRLLSTYGHRFVVDPAYRKFTGKTKIVWIESPTNPRLKTFDIESIARRAHAHGAIVVVDNTFATPLNQRPFDLGADLVVHSVTKYLSGHSDVLQGAVIARDEAIFEPIRFAQNATGATASPFDCWLTLRGLKTLSLRVRQHNANGAAVARWLGQHVERVYYPGFGGVVSFEIEGASELVSSFNYFQLAESLGGVKSLVCHPATMTHAAIPAERRAELGISDNLVRLSCGIEHPEDLIEDLRTAITGRKASGRGRASRRGGRLQEA